MKILLFLLALCPLLAAAPPAAGPRGKPDLESRFSDDAEVLWNRFTQTRLWLRAIDATFQNEDLDSRLLGTIESWCRDAGKLLAERDSLPSPEARIQWCERAEKLVGRWKRFETLPVEKADGRPLVVSVRGLVMEPGTYRSETPLTLSQALGLAGGMHPTGSPQITALYRNAHVVVHNLLSKKHKDVPLCSGDMVVASPSGKGFFAEIDPFAMPGPKPQDLPPVTTPDVAFVGGLAHDILGSGPSPADNAVESGLPIRIRVRTEMIEMASDAYAEMFRHLPADADAAYQAASRLVAGGKARIVGSSIVTANDEQRATIESIREIISPIEAEPHYAPSPPVDPKSLPKFIYIRPPASGGPFETRNVGETLEIEATLDKKDTRFVTLRFAPEYVFMPGMTTWQTWRDKRGRGDAKRPLYYTLRSNSALTLAIGEFQHASTFTPMDPQGKADPSRKWLLFVKVDATEVFHRIADSS